MALSDMLEKILEMLGIKKTDSQQYAKVEQKLRSARSVNTDRLDQLKDKVSDLERQVRQKNREYENATGDTKRIIGGEIERLFRDIDRLRGQETIVTRNMDKISMTLAKVDEWRTAQEQGVDEEMLDGLAIDLEDIFAELKATDRTAKSLDNVKYEEEAKPDSIDIERRMSELQGEKVSSETMSAETAVRLKELDSE